MSNVQSILQLRREGESITDISKKVGVSRDTVYKYLSKDDFSPKIPAKAAGKSVMDEYKSFIEGYLDEDKQNWHKQHHSAKRIFERHLRIQSNLAKTVKRPGTKHNFLFPKIKIFSFLGNRNTESKMGAIHNAVSQFQFLSAK